MFTDLPQFPPFSTFRRLVSMQKKIDVDRAWLAETRRSLTSHHVHLLSIFPPFSTPGESQPLYSVVCVFVIFTAYRHKKWMNFFHGNDDGFFFLG
jgi:hypothetical protein